MSDGATPPRVTPGVRRSALHAAGSDDGARLDRISYEAGAHTHWHLHTGEQILFGEQGHGWVKFDGSARVSIEPGTTAYVPVGVRHWHGAAPDSALVHLAFTAGGGTTWLGQVTADEYAHD